MEADACDIRASRMGPLCGSGAEQSMVCHRSRRSHHQDMGHGVGRVETVAHRTYIDCTWTGGQCTTPVHVFGRGRQAGQVLGLGNQQGGSSVLWTFVRYLCIESAPYTGCDCDGRTRCVCPSMGYANKDTDSRARWASWYSRKCRVSGK